MGADEAANRLPDRDRVPEVVGVHVCVGLHQALCHQPGAKSIRVGEELGTVLEVDRVDVGLDQAQRAARGLPISHPTRILRITVE